MVSLLFMLAQRKLVIDAYGPAVQRYGIACVLVASMLANDEIERALMCL